MRNSFITPEELPTTGDSCINLHSRLDYHIGYSKENLKIHTGVPSPPFLPSLTLPPLLPSPCLPLPLSVPLPSYIPFP